MKTNRGEFEEAAEEFMKWTKAGGRVLPGLVKRRLDEQRLYLS
jgi:lysozyme